MKTEPIRISQHRRTGIGKFVVWHHQPLGKMCVECRHAVVIWTLTVFSAQVLSHLRLQNTSFQRSTTKKTSVLPNPQNAQERVFDNGNQVLWHVFLVNHQSGKMYVPPNLVLVDRQPPWTETPWAKNELKNDWFCFAVFFGSAGNVICAWKLAIFKMFPKKKSNWLPSHPHCQPILQNVSPCGVRQNSIFGHPTETGQNGFRQNAHRRTYAYS